MVFINCRVSFYEVFSIQNLGPRRLGNTHELQSMKGNVELLQFDGSHLKHNNVINFLHGI
jgi:hypothetical protein